VPKHRAGFLEPEGGLQDGGLKLERVTCSREHFPMNLETLCRLTRWSEKIAKAQTDPAAELERELSRAQSTQDPLGFHIFQARASFRRTEDGDRSKAGRKVELSLQLSFTKAETLGFRGSIKMWELLMRSGEFPSERLKRQAVLVVSSSHCRAKHPVRAMRAIEKFVGACPEGCVRTDVSEAVIRASTNRVPKAWHGGYPSRLESFEPTQPLK
jgi:hypothetical protein